MIPGRFHAETFAPFDVPPNDVAVRIAFVTADGAADDGAYLPIDDTDFDIQVSDTELNDDALLRPTRFIVDIVRKGSNRTARCQRGVVPPMHSHAANVVLSGKTLAGAATNGAPGTSTYADVFGGQEYVNADDGEFYFTIRQNGRAKATVGKVVIKANNDRAKAIHDLGGFNQWSDGTIR